MELLETLKTETKDIIAQYSVNSVDVVINNKEERQTAVLKTKELDDVLDKFNDKVMPIEKKAKESYEAIRQYRKDIENRIKTIRDAIADAILKYDLQQEEAMKKKEIEARIQAEKEIVKEKTKLEKKLENVTNEEERQSILNAINSLQPVVKYQEEYEKPKDGTYIRSTWKCRIVNPDAVPREYCKPDEEKIRKIGNATKGKITIPGVEWIEDKTLIVRK